jgi:hypothetical protein
MAARPVGDPCDDFIVSGAVKAVLRWSIAHFVCGVALLVGCSRSTSTSARSGSPRTVMPGSTLPGESTADASRRALYACMEDAGVPFEGGEAIINGIPTKVRGYDLKNQSTAVRLDSCQQKVVAAYPLPISSLDDLKNGHGYIVKLVQCLSDAGHDMGSTPSLEAYSLAKGDIPPSSRWDFVGGDEHYGENFERCSGTVPLPKRSS